MKLIRPALVSFGLLTVLTGLAYPLLVTGIAQSVFPDAANGSLIHHQGKVVGSSLIGQQFSSNQYFWSRPSATAPMSYNGAASGGANLGPTNPDFLKGVVARVTAIRAAHPAQTGPVPVDLVTTSASGLDPDISPASAYYQMGRVAAARHVPVSVIQTLIDQHTQGRQWRMFGEARVNVLQLNLALDQKVR
ncbi:potassium-transporting ATPase subunit KdpC [Leeia oryzae]|uniref:potassium-transporting ATPase subunit KdpC n=1 Tax=Leeia oryzae TaxID=356662 RepID=UPI0003824147|nr:potassium-transporting ATPase subunit KdpC [Leeia oryzae]